MDRKNLVSCLESLLPGVTEKDMVVQSSCFVFVDDFVKTYNDEMSCSVHSPLKGVVGAVRAGSLVELLRRLEEKDVDITQEEKGLVVVGKSKKAVLVMEKEVVSAVADVEKPKEWKPLNEKFTQLIGLVSRCAGHSDLSRPLLSCVRFDPKYIEATDGYQLMRAELNVGMTSMLVRATSLEKIGWGEMSRFCQTENWVHFGGQKGPIYSCRRYVGSYPDLSAFLRVGGSRVVLPSSLVQVIKRADVFKSDKMSDLLFVQLKEGKLRISSSGEVGTYEERKKVDYKGSDLSFYISGPVLEEVCSKSRECFVTSGRLLVKGEGFRFSACTVESVT